MNIKSVAQNCTNVPLISWKSCLLLHHTNSKPHALICMTHRRQDQEVANNKFNSTILLSFYTLTVSLLVSFRPLNYYWKRRGFVIKGA